MNTREFTVKYLLLLAAQVLLWNFFNFTPLLTVALLPVMIFALPLKCGVNLSLAIAFATGFAADFFSGSPLGLSSLALVPAAFLRRPILSAVFGHEIFDRMDDLSSGRFGYQKVLLAIVLFNAVFLSIYVIADSAGVCPIWAMAVKFLLSLVLSSGVSLPIAGLLCPDSAERWK